MKEIKLEYKTRNSSMGKILAVAIVLCLILMAVPILNKQDAPIGFLLVLAITAGLLVFIYSSVYKLSLSGNAIRYSYLIWNGAIQTHDIVAMKMKVVNPISTYGGFGYRIFGKSKRAIILQGNLVLEVLTIDEQIFHFGIDKTDESAIEEYLSAKIING